MALKKAQTKKPRSLSPKQKEILTRALSGEDRQLPEQLHYDRRSGRLLDVMPPRRWYVPPGLVVPSGSVEYQAARTLAAKGLLKPGGVPPSSDLPYGQGGYLITPKGRKFLGG